MSSDTVALVPLRAPGRGKTRLAVGLSPDERAALAAAMLADVVAALRAAPVGRVVVAAGGAEAVAAAAALGVEVVADPPGVSTLDAALRAAAARSRVPAGLLVVTADLPRLRPQEVARLLDTAGQVVVAPTSDGGTGALLRRPADVIATAYGHGSAARHVAAARRAGVTVTTFRSPGFLTDVDTWRDLQALRDTPTGPATAAFLSTIADRLVG